MLQTSSCANLCRKLSKIGKRIDCKDNIDNCNGYRKLLYGFIVKQHIQHRLKNHQTHIARHKPVSVGKNWHQRQLGQSQFLSFRHYAVQNLLGLFSFFCQQSTNL